MKKIIFLVFMSLYLVSCTTLPLTGIYGHNIANNVEVNTLESGFDISYSIDFNIGKDAKNDYISFTLYNTVHKYRLDFYANKEIKKIIADVIALNEYVGQHGKKYGSEKIGTSLLYCYSFSGIGGNEEITRLDANADGKNAVEFSFLVKDKNTYLVLNKFHIKRIYGEQTLDDDVESIPFYYSDIKKLYDFMNNAEYIDKVRSEKKAELNAEQKVDVNTSAVDMINR
ncbi:hypothetical protein [Treponema pedis]|uniref:Uncharacterized protein n=2 Tax=Treponema pedis TaxID=409322 RepID=S5ZR98_9SPIR|nr:hypothetical protein [Treponema pedis]AGT45212.1 hypothetical protein TPE_2740 [Treponema pedis str. T A4]